MNWTDYNPRKSRGKYLIKFLSDEFLFEFLNTGIIWFSRADEFGDKMECVTIDDIEEEPFPFQKLILRKRKHLISCWHNVDSESIAMWDSSFKTINQRRVYALKFETKNLIELIKKSNLNTNTLEKNYGNVVYKNILNDNKTVKKLRVRRSSFRKEASFRYEQEFRFIIKLKDNLNEKGIGLKIGNPKDIPFQIMVNPLLEKEDFIKFERKICESVLAEGKLKHSDLVNYLKPKEW